MYHPLLDNPANLKDAELENRILDLTKKYHIAARMGQGIVCEQIITILSSLKDEQSRRAHDMIKKTQSNQNKNLDDLINVT
jgi:hypothetical protein